MKNLVLLAACSLAFSACTGGGGGGQTSEMVGQGSNSSVPGATDSNGMGGSVASGASATPRADGKVDAPGMPNAQVSPDQYATTNGTSSGTQSLPKTDKRAGVKKKLDASRPGTGNDLNNSGP